MAPREEENTPPRGMEVNSHQQYSRVSQQPALSIETILQCTNQIKLAAQSSRLGLRDIRWKLTAPAAAPTVDSVELIV